MPEYFEFLPGVPEWKQEQLKAKDAEEAPLSPTSGQTAEGSDTVYTTGGHSHEWVVTDEGRDDEMLTAICSICGSGIHYHKEVHGVENGSLTVTK